MYHTAQYNGCDNDFLAALDMLLDESHCLSAFGKRFGNYKTNFASATMVASHYALRTSLLMTDWKGI